MSDEQQHEWVRDALASARAEQPAPPEVAARLDARLAELHHEREPVAPEEPRRRRLGPLVLAAAAVAAVVAIGVPVVRQMSGSGVTPTGSGSAASSSAREAAPQSAAAPSPSQTLGRDMAGAQQIRLTSAGFAADSAPLVAALVHPSTATVPAVPGPYCDYKVDDPGVRQRPVLLDGQPALLAVYPAADGVRPVKALSCTDGATLASTTVPAS